MTERELREKVVSTARKYLGYKESDGSHKKIIDIYNNHKPLAQNYRMTYKDSWCAATVSAISILCELTDIMPTECSCSRMIELYKKLDKKFGRWEESDNYRPSIGDIMMYDWNDSGRGNNTGMPDHVGIVANISGDIITVIEGNMNNKVGYRDMKVGGRYIRGYCLPNYANKVAKINSANKVSNSSKPSTANSRIDSVKEVQQWANSNYKAGLVVDGVYGAKTKRVLVKILQTEINKTYGTKLVVDGIWGEKTRASCPTLSVGANNGIVGALQAMLICNSFTWAYLDKVYGLATTSAVTDYQKKNGLVVDGIAGKNTFAKLCS